MSTALYLSDKGLRVAVCEKGYIAGEQSSRNWGWVRVTHRDMREFELSIESLKLWRTLDRTLGIDTGFRQCGILYMANDDAKMEGHRVWLEKAHALAGNDAFDTREVDPKAVAGLLPGATRAFKGGLYTAGDGRAEPQKAAPAIANALRKRGVKILTPCAVRGLETSAGRVSAVVTELGTIRCKSVVVAGGAWSRLFCGNLDINVPQLMVKASVLRTSPIEGGPAVSASNKEFAFRKRVDGVIRLHSAFVPTRISRLTASACFPSISPRSRVRWARCGLDWAHVSSMNCVVRVIGRLISGLHSKTFARSTRSLFPLTPMPACVSS